MAKHAESSSLAETLRRWARERPDVPAYTYLADGESEAGVLTFAQLDRRARAIAAELGRRNAAGERVVLLFPPGLEFVSAFLGCLYAGAVAVPCHPPRFNRPQPRLQAIARDADPAIVLTVSSLAARAGSAGIRVPELAALPWVATDGLEEQDTTGWRAPRLASSRPAMLQYTSGSTSLPKGVIVSHGNLVHNEEMIRRAFGQSESSVIVSWLPLYHDMGLIGGVLQPLYTGARCVLMSPLAFLQSPIRWLQAVSRFRGTTSGGPNFAYELCVDKVREEQRQGLDLSSWEVAFNGAEPVRAQTLRRFSSAFASAGFRPEAFFPCYGLAEATLFVTGGPRGEIPSTAALDPAALGEGRVEDASGDGAVRELVSCGNPWMDQQVVIVEPETGERCLPGRVGEIWIAGPSVARGYWNRAEATERDFGGRLRGEPATGPFLRTGDLGFLRDGALFVTGRLKDLVIVRGRNHYPQDLELTAERSHPALRPGCGAAFQVDVEGEERLVMVYEVVRGVRGVRSGLAEAADAVRRAIAEEHELAVHDLVFLRQETVPKTSSGKIQRHACRDLYQAGGLAVVASFPTVPSASSALPMEDLRWERDALLGRDRAGRRELLESYLRDRFSRVLRVPAGELDASRPLSGFGLDSLSAVELGHAIETDLEIALPISSLLEAVDLAGLAEALLERLETGGSPYQEPWPDAGLEDAGPFPLSWGQRALWFQQRLAPHSAAYHIAAAARIGSSLDVPALERAFRNLLRRHPVLRTRFDEEAGEPVQRVEEVVDLDFAREDAAGWSAGRLLDPLQGEIGRPFDLTAGSPVRVRIWQVSAGENVLLVVVHHLVADFRSLEILANDLGRLYAAEIGPAAAPELPFRPGYRRFVEWQQRLLSGPRGEELWGGLRRRLAGAPLEIELSTDRPRPEVPSHRGGSESVLLDSSLGDRLRALARERRTTPFLVLLAGFQILLHRWSGQEDLLVGAPAAGRSAPESAEMVGYLVNPLVLRARFPEQENADFPGFLERARQDVLDAMEHQDYPFPLLAERLQPVRLQGLNPVFQVMFVWQKARLPRHAGLAALALGAGGARVDLGGLELESLELEQRSAQLDITLTLAELEGGARACLTYSRDLFDRVTARRMLGHLQVLLEAVAGHPGLPVSALPILAPEEERQLLGEWNPAVSLPGPVCLHQLFEAQARKAPGAVALVCRGERLTYRELDRRADRLALRLRALGVGAETPVGVLLERSSWLVVSLLAVLKAGGAYVPLDPAYPVERLALMLEDSAAPVLLTEPSLEQRLFPQRPAKPVLCMVGPAEEPACEPSPLPGVEPQNLAYVIYTSGSTGRPKGVAIEHASASALMFWAREVFPPEDLAGVLAATSVCFDLSVFELFAPLSWGGAVILAENALELPSLPAAGEVTLVNTVPSVMEELVTGGGLPRSVRTVNLAGEPLRKRLVDRIHGAAAVERVFNLYGPSEDTTYSTFTPVPASWGLEPSIGRPLAGTRAYILDRIGRLVPRGVAGELHLGGAGLARGYLRRPDLTAEKFIPDRFTGVPGARIYRTGDLARYRADGEIEFLGRIDHQVKVRGFRIELEEVEAALLSCPGVREIVVTLWEEPTGDRRLVAYLASSSVPPPAVEELRSLLRRRLPHHFVPAAFVLLPALPRTPNGKVDRRALPPPSWAALAAGAEHTEPRGPVEELLAGIWCELLSVEQLGVQANFFELGGHSLLATRMLSRVRDALRVELPLSAVFEAQTLGGLAERIAAARQAAGPLAVPALVRMEHAGAPPLSFAQERLWFLDQLEPGLPVYNVPGALRWKERLDVAALEGAFDEILRRHEVLRTRIETVGERPVQIIEPPRRTRLPLIDLSGLGERDGEIEARRLATAEARRPFDLAKGPLFRVALIRVSPAHHLVLATVHHIASDGWSLGILLREMAVLYDAFASGRPSPLPELPFRYSDYALWQRSWLQGDVLATQLEYWRDRLSGAPPALELPTDRPRPPVQSFRGGDRRLALPAPLSGRLQEFARREEVTLYMALLSVFVAILHRHSGQSDLLVGTPLANRGRAETESLIGFFVNTLVIRTDTSDDPSFRELARRVRRTVLEVHAHQDLPLEKLVEELQLERDLSRAPLFQVVFALQNLAVKLPDLPGISLGFEHVPTATSKFDLMLDLSAQADEIAGYFEHSADLFDAVTIDRMASHLLTLLRAALETPDHRLSDLPLLGATERHHLLTESNDTAAHRPAQRYAHQLFEAWAVRAPGAVAVISEDRQLTYGELDRRANRLAHHLVKLGAGPDVPVALCLERSPDLIVGMLGILKAGGAYVPLDPGYPESRSTYLIEDCGSRIVVTEERLAGRFTTAGLRVVRLDADAVALATEPDGSPAAWIDPSNLAYLIYTSGSTGRPKGVAVEHRHILNYLDGISRRLDFDGVDSFATVSTFAADLGNTVVYPALCRGGCLHLVSQERAADAQGLGEYFQRNRVDCLKLVPSHLEALLDSPRPAAVLPRQRLVLGGEAASRELIERLVRISPRCRIFNHYGPSETTVGVLTQAVGNGQGGRHGTVVLPLGRPLLNVQVHLLDPSLAPVPLGVAGEIYIGGDSVARGYFHRPGLTAERFVPDPFSPGGRLYRTGDRARRLPSGELVFLGRLDDQLKFHGYRIEPNEIRSALNRHPKVRDSMVVLRRDVDGRDQLIAYYVSRQEVGSAELRDFLAGSIIEETIPTLFVRLGKIPLTLNGKINFEALPSLAEIRGKDQQELVPPRTPTEETLAAIWKGVLGIDRLSVHDNFFELGGHSLLATRVLSRIRQTFAVAPPLRTFFEKPTIARFALVITELQTEQEDREEMARMLDELAGLSSDDLQQLLEAEIRLQGREEAHE